MKKLSTITIGVLALAAGSVYAGGGPGGCTYGEHSSVISADANDALENSAADETTDPKLLALLKKKAIVEKLETATN